MRMHSTKLAKSTDCAPTAEISLVELLNSSNCARAVKTWTWIVLGWCITGLVMPRTTGATSARLNLQLCIEITTFLYYQMYISMCCRMM